MSDDRDRELGLRARVAYRRIPPLGAEARDRLLDTIRESPPPARHGFLRTLAGRRSFRTLAALAGAAAVVLMVVSVTALDRRSIWPRPRPEERAGGAVSDAVTSNTETQFVSFQIQAAGAERVALVGDFNGWDPQAAPMERAGAPDTWAVTVVVPHGRHLYAFLINGRRWLADPLAPLAPEDGYGVPNSVVIVGGLAAS